MEDLFNFEDILICFLFTTENSDEVLETATIELFKNPLNKECFEIAKKLKKDNKEVSLVNAVKAGMNKELLLKINRMSNSLTIGQLSTPVEFYISEIKEQFYENQIEKRIKETVVNAVTSNKWQEEAELLIKDLNLLLDTGTVNKRLKTIKDIAHSERQSYYLREELAKTGKMSGLNSGIEAINKFTGGFQKELIILAGRPSMGKTALALFHACNIGEPGIYFNLEMNDSQLCQRLILQYSNEQILSNNLRDGRLTNEEKIKFEQTVGIIEGLPVYVYDKAKLSLQELSRVVRKEHREGRCNWVIIDYLQLMTIEGIKFPTRELEVAEISRSLKALQKDLNIPIIALAQLSRGVEQRADKKPMLSDLRESGSIEQDADTVIMIWRPKYYGLNNEAGVPYENEIFYLFEKHRQGAVGICQFYHNQTTSNFSDNPNSFSQNNYQPMKSLKPNIQDWDSDDREF